MSFLLFFSSTLFIVCLIEFFYIRFQWTKVTDVQDITKDVASITTIDRNKHYNKVIVFLGKVLNKFSKLLIIPIILLLFVNTVLSFILSGLLWLVF